MTDAIKIKNLSKSFGNFRLGPLDFEVKKGTITGFIGENGAGKSTTIKLILDVIARDGGGIEIFGKDIKDLSVDEKYKLGFVYDDLFLSGSMKVDEIEKCTAFFMETVGRRELFMNLLIISPFLLIFH